MPFSPLDALMQIATPTRSLEPSVRNDGPGAFAPALEQAYQAELPRCLPAPQPVEQKPQAENTSASGEKQESEQPTDDAAATAESVDGVNAAADQEESDSADGAGEDAVEISAAGAAAAAVVQEAKSVEQQVVVKSSDAEKDAGEVKEVDAKAAAEAAKKQAEAAADAAALQEGATNENAPDGATAADKVEEVVVSTLSSTRRQSGDERKRDDAATRPAAAEGKSGEKKSSETPVGANAAAEAAEVGEVEQVEEVVAETTAEPDGESRQQSGADETAVKNEETKQVASQNTTAAASDAAATAVNAADRADAAATEVAGSSPTPAVVDSPPPTEASPRPSGALDRLMAGHSLKSSKEASDPNGMPTVDRARFVQRVEGAMKAAQQRDGKIQVRLSPPDLGSIKIELAVQNGVLSAKLEAETPAARNLLLDSLPALRERLAQQDIRVDKFDVDVRDQGGNAGSGQADDRTADQSGDRQNGRPRPAATRAVALPTTSSRGSVGASSAAAGLDVRV
ncbi:MAG: hypothetical protein C0485_03275 [Pirellula sp.]|nr:hypothetical protein [Pirellula sp.]